jgi:hypothetical protein
MFHDPRELAGRVLGVDLAAARAAARELDRAALRAIGIDLDPEPAPPAPAPTKSGGRLAWTSGARAVLVLAVAQARRAKARRITTEHLLLALLTLRRPDPAGQLLEALGVDAGEARARLQSGGGQRPG